MGIFIKKYFLFAAAFLAATICAADLTVAESGNKPEKGMKIDFNAFAEYDQIYGMIWEYNAQQRSWRNPYDHAGTLILE